MRDHLPIWERSRGYCRSVGVYIVQENVHIYKHLQTSFSYPEPARLRPRGQAASGTGDSETREVLVLPHGGALPPTLGTRAPHWEVHRAAVGGSADAALQAGAGAKGALRGRPTVRDADMNLAEQTVRWRTRNPILQARTAMGLRPEEVAERLGLTRYQVAGWEGGDAALDENQMTALGALLGIETSRRHGRGGWPAGFTCRWCRRDRAPGLLVSGPMLYLDCHDLDTTLSILLPDPSAR